MKKTILIVVADKTDHIEYIKFFPEKDYKILFANNGIQALDIYQSKHPDIILLDFIIPIISGLEVLEDIRKYDKKTPIVIFTANTSKKKILHAAKLGINDFISKSENISNVKSRIDSILFNNPQKSITDSAAKTIYDTFDKKTIPPKKKESTNTQVIRDEITTAYKNHFSLVNLKVSNNISLLNDILNIADTYNESNRASVKRKIYNKLKKNSDNSLKNYLSKCEIELKDLHEKTKETVYEIKFTNLSTRLEELINSSYLKDLY